MNKTAQTSVPIEPLLANRWSSRALDPEAPIKLTQKFALLEAFRWAPSCMNAQPWRILMLDKFTDSKNWHKAFDCLSPGNQTWVKNAVLLALVCSDTLFERDQSPNPWAKYDTGAATQNLCLQAHSMGLIAHQLGGFSVPKIQESFCIPERFRPMVVVALGLPGNLADLADNLIVKEELPRQRLALDSIAFSGSWGEKFDTLS